MKIKTLSALTGTLVAVTGMGIAVHKVVIPGDQAMSELAQLNLEALTSAESQPTKANKTDTYSTFEEQRQHMADGYKHYDIVTEIKTSHVKCSGIGYIECTPATYIEVKDPYTEECPYNTVWDCKLNRE